MSPATEGSLPNEGWGGAATPLVFLGSRMKASPGVMLTSVDLPKMVKVKRLMLSMPKSLKESD